MARRHWWCEGWCGRWCETGAVCEWVVIQWSFHIIPGWVLDPIDDWAPVASERVSVLWQAAGFAAGELFIGQLSKLLLRSWYRAWVAWVVLVLCEGLVFAFTLVLALDFLSSERVVLELFVLLWWWQDLLCVAGI